MRVGNQLRLKLFGEFFLKIILCSFFLCSCTPALSTMLPARTTPDGHLQVVTALEGSVPSGKHREVLEELNSVKKLKNITPEQIRTIAESSSAFFVQPPGVNPHVMASYGLSNRFEIGLRGSSDMFKGWCRYQFLRVSPGFYGALGIGLGTYFSGFPIQDYTKLAKTTSYTRNEMDMPVQFGFSGRVGHLWFGPKFIFADYEVKAEVCSRKDSTGCLEWGDTQSNGTTTYLGGQIGGAIGYKRIWFVIELSIMHMSIDADIDVNIRSVSETLAMHHDGVVLSPSLGLIMWF